jgi:hypothetical protein
VSPLNALAACAGSWLGTSTLQDPHAGIAEESPSTATVTSFPDGSVRLDYTWSYRGKPQQGSILFGVDGVSESLTARWTDTWHTPSGPMECSGPPGTSLSVRGKYAAPPGPDWGWRIDVQPGGQTLRVVMHNVWPEEQGGKEELAVEAAYTRA